MSKGKIIVVGGGLAGLMATIKAAEKGAPVDLFSLVPVKRSPLRLRTGWHKRSGQYKKEKGFSLGTFR